MYVKLAETTKWHINLKFTQMFLLNNEHKIDYCRYMYLISSVCMKVYDVCKTALFCVLDTYIDTIGTNMVPIDPSFP